MDKDEAEKAVKELTIKSAAGEYFDRRLFRSHPKGYQDDAGRWHLAKEEQRECCKKVKNWHRFNNHARSLEHVAALFGVDPHELRKVIAESLDEHIHELSGSH